MSGNLNYYILTHVCYLYFSVLWLWILNSLFLVINKEGGVLFRCGIVSYEDAGRACTWWQAFPVTVAQTRMLGNLLEHESSATLRVLKTFIPHLYVVRIKFSSRHYRTIINIRKAINTKKYLIAFVLLLIWE